MTLAGAVIAVFVIPMLPEKSSSLLERGCHRLESMAVVHNLDARRAVRTRILGGLINEYRQAA